MQLYFEILTLTVNFIFYLSKIEDVLSLLVNIYVYDFIFHLFKLAKIDTCKFKRIKTNLWTPPPVNLKMSQQLENKQIKDVILTNVLKKELYRMAEVFNNLKTNTIQEFLLFYVRRNSIWHFKRTPFLSEYIVKISLFKSIKHSKLIFYFKDLK